MAVKKTKKEELIPLDENMIMITGELIKHITPISINSDQYINKKTIIIDEKTLNEYLTVNVKLAQIKDIKKVYMSILDNDILEIDLSLEKFDSKSNIKKQLKIHEIIINKQNAYFKYLYEDTYDTKGNDIISKIMLLFTKYIIKQSFTPEIIKKFSSENLLQNNEKIEIDLKESMNTIYSKTINEIFNTAVPLYGHKKIPDLFQIESIMCEKGQIWVDYIYNISIQV
ncbi:MAG: hypothetical protein U0354_05250 [Candidatus Sericytochromatia bacterium]